MIFIYFTLPSAMKYKVNHKLYTMHVSVRQKSTDNQSYSRISLCEGHVLLMELQQYSVRYNNILTRSKRIHEVRNQGGEAISVAGTVPAGAAVDVDKTEARAVAAIRRRRT